MIPPPCFQEGGESEDCKNLDSMLVTKTFLMLPLLLRKERKK